MGNNIGIALQLYTVRAKAAQDAAATLARVRDIGFDYVEWAGMPELSAEALRELVNETGVTVVSAHLQSAEPAALEQEIAGWHRLGVPDLAVPMMPEVWRANRAAWLEGAQQLDALGQQLLRQNIRLSYHNHDFELTAFPGDNTHMLDLLYTTVPLQHLFAELDTAWLHVGGVDPAEYIRAYGGRCALLHVKDVAAQPDADGQPVFVPLGTGVLDWENIFDAAEEAGVEWYVYEQDTVPADPYPDLIQSYEFLAAHV